MKSWRTVSAVTGSTILMGLTIFLLTTSRYFSIPDLPENWTFGLEGVAEPSGKFDSYANLIDSCERNPTFSVLCQFYQKLWTGGRTLYSLLVLSLLNQGLAAIHAVAGAFLLSKTVQILSQGHQVSPGLVKCTRVFLCLQFFSFLDPLLNISGVVLWAVLSDFPEMGAKFSLHAEEGLIVLVLKAFLSLVFQAIFLVAILENKRENKKMMARRHQKDASTCVLATEKGMGKAGFGDSVL